MEYYTVVISNSRNTLTRDQIEFDSPNYFTSYFLGESGGSPTRTLILYRNATLFEVVKDYLNGYEVLPLHKSVLPERMSPDVGLRNLLADAQYYCLNGLVNRINTVMAPPPATGPTQCVVISVEPGIEGVSKVGLPVPTSEEALTGLRQKHGFDAEMSRDWDMHVSNIKFSFDRAQLSVGSYTVEALWGELVEGTKIFSYALKLIMQ